MYYERVIAAIFKKYQSIKQGIRYEKRAKEMERLAEILGVKCVIDEYNKQDYRTLFWALILAPVFLLLLPVCQCFVY